MQAECQERRSVDSLELGEPRDIVSLENHRSPAVCHVWQFEPVPRRLIFGRPFELMRESELSQVRDVLRLEVGKHLRLEVFQLAICLAQESVKSKHPLVPLQDHPVESPISVFGHQFGRELVELITNPDSAIGIMLLFRQPVNHHQGQPKGPVRSLELLVTGQSVEDGLGRIELGEDDVAAAVREGMPMRPQLLRDIRPQGVIESGSRQSEHDIGIGREIVGLQAAEDALGIAVDVVEPLRG